MFWVLSLILGTGPSSKLGWFVVVFNIVSAALGKCWPKSKLFGSQKPLPAKHARVEPGDKLWQLELYYPRRKLRTSDVNGQPCKEVHLWLGLFRCVRFLISERDEAIASTVFVFRSERVARKVKKAALAAFGLPDKRIDARDTLVWMNICHFEVRISPTTYEVRRRPSKRKPRPPRPSAKK